MKATDSKILFSITVSSCGKYCHPNCMGYREAREGEKVGATCVLCKSEDVDFRPEDEKGRVLRPSPCHIREIRLYDLVARDGSDYDTHVRARDKYWDQDEKKSWKIPFMIALVWIVLCGFIICAVSTQERGVHEGYYDVRYTFGIKTGEYKSGETYRWNMVWGNFRQISLKDENVYTWSKAKNTIVSVKSE